MSTVITLATMKFYVFIVMSSITLAICLYRSKEARLKKLLAKELSIAINPFLEIPKEKFRGGGESFYRKKESLTFQTGAGLTTIHVARLVQQTLHCCGFKSTAPVRRNGGVHTLTATKGKNQFLVEVLNGLHIPNSFILSVETVPICVRDNTE